MIPRYSAEDLADDKARTLAFVAQHLAEGQVTLLLGAGVSQPHGLPSWNDLVKECEIRSGVRKKASSKKRTNSDLMSAVNEVADKTGGGAKFLDVVHQSLYSDKLRSAGTYPHRTLRNELLIALGALCAQSSARGSVRNVVTLNFDDLLEHYLRLHGLRVDSQAKFPAVVSEQADVRVYHPHGFLPLTGGDRSTFLVFSEDDFVDQLAGVREAWTDMLVQLMSSTLLLAVGTSLSDINMRVSLRKARVKGDDRTVRGVVLLVRKPTKKTRSDFLKHGIVPLYVPKTQIPSFLLDVCQTSVK